MANIAEGTTVGRRVKPLLIREDVSLPIYWLNEEWAVTPYGMESLCPESPYLIDKPRLGLVRGNRADWPAQLEDKGWTDPRLFVEAFFKALEIHDVKHSFDYADEKARADDAADQLVAHQEMNRRRAESSGGGVRLMSLEELSGDERAIDDLMDQGFTAPEFPTSCVKRRA